MSGMRQAIRALRRTPAFAAAVIVSLSLGLAALASMFTVLYGVQLAPLPFDESGRLVSIGLDTRDVARVRQPPALFETYARHAPSLDGIAFHRTGNANLATRRAGDAPDSVTATWITASMLPVLRVEPLLGRNFDADDTRFGGTSAVILGEAEWRTRFGARRDVIGTVIEVNSVPREIVGVMPAGFAFPDHRTRVWLPVRTNDDAIVDDFSYSAIARLAPGATIARAREELAAALPRMAEQFPRLDAGGTTAAWLDDARPVPVVQSLRDEITAGIGRTLWLLAATALLVLLVAWANVANLMLMRADARHGELVVRRALGASRGRIVAALLREALLLGAAAAAVAWLAAIGAVRLLVAFGPADVPRLATLAVDGVTVALIVLATAVGAVVTVAAPAWRIWRLEASRDLHLRGRDDPRGRAGSRFRAAISVVQIALALAVCIGSALLLRTAERLHRVPPGFDPAGVTIIRTQLPFARYDDADGVAFYARLVARVRELPMVDAAGAAMRVPLAVGGERLQQTLRDEASGRALSLAVNIVDDGYFAAMRIRPLAGRGFEPIARDQGTDIVISRTASAAWFDDPTGAAAIDRRVTLAPSGPTYTIIGVVDDVRDDDLAIAPGPTVYRAQAVPVAPAVEPGARRAMALVVRSDAPTEALVPAIRRIVGEIDPAIPLFKVESMVDVVRASTAQRTLVLALVTVAALVALLLGAVGIYGVMAYRVALRTREIGVRVALGAAPGRIARLVAMHGVVLVATGVAGGFVLYAIAAPFLRAFLFGVTASDPVAIVGATLVLGVIAFVAGALPARRAARIDPVVALRAT